MRKPLERRIYELACKHCGRQFEWTVLIAVLAKKSGSTSPLRVFRSMLRDLIRENRMPDDLLAEESRDLLRVTARAAIHDPADGPHLRSEPLGEVRLLCPGADVHALQAEWQRWWVLGGRKLLRSSDRAFLEWVKMRDV